MAVIQFFGPSQCLSVGVRVVAIIHTDYFCPLFFQQKSGKQSPSLRLFFAVKDSYVLRIEKLEFFALSKFSSSFF